MILIQLIVCGLLIFLSGFHWCAYKIDKLEDRPTARNSVAWSVVCGLLGLYHLIALIGAVSQ